MMKLWYSTSSPYARKAVVAVLHHKLTDKVEMLKLLKSSADPTAPHNQDNPLGRVPALQRNCGRWLFGSLLIAEYLDSKGSESPLFPKEGKARWNVLALHNLADGIMENTMPVLSERMLRPENEWGMSRQNQLMERNQRSFVQLEQAVKEFGTELNIGTLTTVCLVDWYLFRADILRLDLNAICPALVQWSKEMNRLYPELAETPPRVSVA